MTFSKPTASPVVSRRSFCTRLTQATAAVAAGSTLASPAPAAAETPVAKRSSRSSFADILRPPDSLLLFTDKARLELRQTTTGVWQAEGVEVRTTPSAGSLQITLTCPTLGPVRMQLRWRADLHRCRLFLGDHWERSYADLEWRGEMPNRPLPWYFLTYDGAQTHAYGVRVQPNAFCFWTADYEGLSLWADLRSGGVGVQLGSRVLSVCTVLSQAGAKGESPFAAACRFARAMCPKPLLPREPIHGTNDWYYSYGNNRPEDILRVTELVASLMPPGGVKPYSLIDAGWSPGGTDAGPYNRGNERFGDMAAFAGKLRQAGARPGLWLRPLVAAPEHSANLRQSRERTLLDPTLPEVAALVTADIKGARAWGYELIKHDFTSVDILGRWGFDMGSTLTHDGWSFADRTRTTAEIVLALYRQLREAAGDTPLIGCNTFSHLSAGLFEISRTGDDVSGRSWDRTRRMGVNTLAFRACHHNAFYAADPDIAAITSEHPWDLGRHWIRLVAESGMPFFVSPQLSATGPEQKAVLKDAFAAALSKPPLAEPLDWLETSIPRRWKLRGQTVTFDWMGPSGAWPFRD